MIARGVLACVVLFIVGCAQQSLLESTDYQQQRAALLSHSDWQLRGKIGLSLDGKPRSAMLNWQQADDHYAIRLNGPFGVGAVRIERLGEKVSLVQAGKPPINAASADELLYQVTGLSAPLANIRYWIRGLAAESPITQLRYDPHTGLPASFQQDGWQLNFDRYRQHNEFLLPGRIVLQPADNTASGASEKVTILVSRWTIPSTKGLAL